MDGHKITNSTKHLCSKKVSGAEEKKSRKLQKFLVDMCSDYLNPEKELKFLKLWCEVCGPVTFGIRPFHESYSPVGRKRPRITVQVSLRNWCPFLSSVNNTFDSEKIAWGLWKETKM